jgi:hypothetical protein
MRRRRGGFVLPVKRIALLTSSSAAAHNLGAECKLRGANVEVEAYFDDDSPARDAKVHVLDQEGKTVAQGRTDAQGRWTFSTPPPGRYRVAVDGGYGHLAEVKITVPSARQPRKTRQVRRPSAKAPTARSSFASPCSKSRWA